MSPLLKTPAASRIATAGRTLRCCGVWLWGCWNSIRARGVYDPNVTRQHSKLPF